MKVDFTSFGLAILLKIKEKLWSISPKRESNAGVHKPSLNPSGDPELGIAWDGCWVHVCWILLRVWSRIRPTFGQWHLSSEWYDQNSRVWANSLVSGWPLTGGESVARMGSCVARRQREWNSSSEVAAFIACLWCSLRTSVVCLPVTSMWIVGNNTSLNFSAPPVKSTSLLRLRNNIRYKDKEFLLSLFLEVFCSSCTMRIRFVAICLNNCSDPKGQ